MQGKLCCKKRSNYDRHLQILEKNILVQSDFIHKLKTKDIPIEVFNPITKKTEESWIHTHIIPHNNPNRPTITFLHGFGGSSATYLDFLKPLSNYFNVISIDLLGMGCSGKPDLKWIKLTPKQIIDIFVSSLEQWRKGMKITRKIDFLGHSLGSYFATFYAAKYPERVNSICGMSTPCVTPPPPGFNPKDLNLDTKRKMMYYFWSFMNKRLVKGHTAFSLMPMKFLVNFWLKGRSKYTEEKKKAIVEFLSTMFWDSRFSSDIITGLMGYLGYTDKMPMTLALKKLADKENIKLKYFYGDKDWLDFKEFVREIKEMELHADVEIVEGIAHQMPKLEPERICDLVKGFYDEVFDK